MLKSKRNRAASTRGAYTHKNCNAHDGAAAQWRRRGLFPLGSIYYVRPQSRRGWRGHAIPFTILRAGYRRRPYTSLGWYDCLPRLFRRPNDFDSLITCRINGGGTCNGLCSLDGFEIHIVYCINLALRGHWVGYIDDMFIYSDNTIARQAYFQSDVHKTKYYIAWFHNLISSNG